MLGHELKHVYGYFPLNPSMGLACVIVSYNGRITMTLVADHDIVDDVDALEDYLKDAYEELAATVRPKAAPQPIAVEAMAVATNGAVKQNGGSAEHVQFALADAPADLEVEQVPVAVMTRTVHRLFSDGWAKAMHEVINNSEDYRNASTRWAAGSLAFVMEADPAHGFDTPAAVWFDLHRGICRSSKAMPAAQALREAAYVIQGNYAAWMDVLSGKSAPLMMLTRGRLKLKKGALLGLLPHTRSASELVRCAQRVPWE
jgi:putative sterol carrier protein